MMQAEILGALRRLTATERLTVSQTAFQQIYDDLQHREQAPAQVDTKQQWAMAAEALLPDYVAGGELTIFTILDKGGRSL